MIFIVMTLVAVVGIALGLILAGVLFIDLIDEIKEEKQP